MPECYVRGNTIKYLRVPDEVIDKVQEETIKRQGQRSTCSVRISLLLMKLDYCSPCLVVGFCRSCGLGPAAVMKATPRCYGNVLTARAAPWISRRRAEAAPSDPYVSL